MKLKELFRLYKRVFVQRKHKDILIHYIFRDKKELLQLYNAVNHTNYSNPDDLVINTMEDVIYIGMKNDLSFLIANELNLYEHQSTMNYNMPLRGLFYFAKMYESYIETHGLNRFENFSEEPAVECVAKFININYGHNQELMSNCKRLHDYSYFVECIRSYLRKGFGRKAAIVQATEECIQKGILEDVLVKNRAEVVDMFLTTFDRKMYEDALREEGREEIEQKYAELTQKHSELAKEYARKLSENGIPFEVAKKIITELNEKELAEIYRK